MALSTWHLVRDLSYDDAANLAALSRRCNLLDDAPEYRTRRAATVKVRRALGNLFEGVADSARHPAA